MRVVTLLKAQHLDLMETIRFLFTHAKELKPSETQVLTSTLLMQMESTAFLIASVFVAEGLAQRLINDKFRTYLAVWFSGAVSLVPNTILNTIWVIVEWRYATPSLPISI